jgi:hypothetical protein
MTRQWIPQWQTPVVNQRWELLNNQSHYWRIMIDNQIQTRLDPMMPSHPSPDEHYLWTGQTYKRPTRTVDGRLIVGDGGYAFVMHHKTKIRIHHLLLSLMCDLPLGGFQVRRNYNLCSDSACVNPHHFEYHLRPKYMAQAAIQRAQGGEIDLSATLVAELDLYSPTACVDGVRVRVLFDELLEVLQDTDERFPTANELLDFLNSDGRLPKDNWTPLQLATVWRVLVEEHPMLRTRLGE